MADIFISYAREDRSTVEPLAKSLEDQGWSVFWDRTIPAGKTWRDVIGEALENARSVIVAWSKTSVKSRWVQEEADWGLERNILIPIFIDDVRPPLGFGAVHAEDLTDWDPSQSSVQFEKLISDLSSILGPSPLKVREEQKRAEEEQRRRQEEAEAKRKAEEEKRRREQEKRERKAAEEKRRKEQELKRKAEEDQKRRGIKAKIKPDKLEPDAIAASEPRKKGNALKFGIMAGVVVLIIVGIGWWSYQQKETKSIADRKGRVFVASTPNNATIKILNIDEPFQQGIELDPGKYHLQVSSKGYEPQERWIELGPGETSRIILTLKKIPSKVGKLFVETVPKDATVKILNIRPKFSQGMELEPGNYHVEVAAEGYETERRWIDLVAGNEKPFRFELTKIKLAEPISPQQTITNIIDMKFVLLPAGKFVMGSPPDEPGRNNDEKQHEVRISKPFYLQTTEVSQAQWKKVIGKNPSSFKDCGDNCPVENVSWEDAQKFISKLNQIERTNKYRLPTEAEWEYACRAETTTPFFTGECISVYQANYDGHYPGQNCPTGIWRRTTVKVGSFLPNDWGLYDMHGNVWEWVEDWYGDYPSKSVVDPKGPDKGELRVLRGGSWDHYARYMRSANRQRGKPLFRTTNQGFRVARDF